MALTARHLALALVCAFVALAAPSAAIRIGLADDKPVVEAPSTDLVLALQQCSGVQTWTLHGLWPNWGSSCGSEKFDPSQVASIQSNMSAFWMSCPEYGQSNDEFWAHEWSKHGTCMHNATQLQFFTLGLELYHKYMSGCQSSSGTCQTCLTPSYTLCNRR